MLIALPRQRPITAKMRFLLLLFNVSLLLSLSPAQIMDNQDTVALIIGGVRDDDVLSKLKASVELFGCPDEESFEVDEFPPGPSYLTGGKYIASLDAALVCGGYSCSDDGFCAGSNECYQWNPKRQWIPAEDLIGNHWGHIMAVGPNLDSPDGDIHPIVLGFQYNVEIFNGSSWTGYKDIPTSHISGWNSEKCLTQHNNFVYSANEVVEVLDLNTWTIEVIGPIPLQPTNVRTCSVTEVDGKTGSPKKAISIELTS